MTERGGENVEALFRRYGPELRRHAARLLHGTSHDADDVLQEVTLRALARHGDAPLDLAYPRAWLHTCVQNACLSHLRAARSAPPPLALEDEVALGDQHDPHALTARRAEAREVLEDLARLDVRQRRALLVSALSDGSHADVAAELGGSERAVTSLVSRARGNLKAMRDARATPCGEIRAEIDEAAARGVRAPERVRRHALSCRSCRLYGEGRRRRSRIAGLLAPLHGLVAAFQPSMPVAMDTSLVHGVALTAVLAGSVAHGASTAAPPVHARAAVPAHVVAPAAPRTTPAAGRGAPVVVVTSKAKRAARAPHATKRRHAGATPAPRRTKPIVLDAFGCPKIVGRMTRADMECRNDRQDEVRREIEARVARHRAAAAASTAAPATATIVPSSPSPAPPPSADVVPAPAPTPAATTPTTPAVPPPPATTTDPAPPPPPPPTTTAEPPPPPPPAPDVPPTSEVTPPSEP